MTDDIMALFDDLDRPGRGSHYCLRCLAYPEAKHQIIPRLLSLLELGQLVYPSLLMLRSPELIWLIP